MNATIIFSYFTSAIFLLLGLGFLINPMGMISSLGFRNLSAEALIDVRATYGGFLLFVGLLMTYWAYTGSLRSLLQLTAFSFTGFFIGRVIGLFQEPREQWGAHLYWAIFEAFYLVLTLYFYQQNQLN